MEMAEILHTQEAHGSSPCAPTIKINKIESSWLTSYGKRRRSTNLMPVDVVYDPGGESPVAEFPPKLPQVPNGVPDLKEKVGRRRDATRRSVCEVGTPTRTTSVYRVWSENSN